MRMFWELIREQKGQGIVEYGLILALVAMATLASVGDSVGNSVGDNIVKANVTFLEPIDRVEKPLDKEEGPLDKEEGPLDKEEVVDPREERVDHLVKNEGYVPVSSADELENLLKNKTQVSGEGTKWEGQYELGLNKKYIQASDIDLGGIKRVKPIGGKSRPFKGTFDGGGYVMSGLSVSQKSKDYGGLFGRAVGATFENIGLVNVDIKGDEFVGGLVGHQSKGSTIVNSYVEGNVFGDGDNVGGLVGYQQRESSVVGSYANVSVQGKGDFTGGLVGNQERNSFVKNSYALGKVSSKGDYVGGLMGRNAGSVITDSSWANDVTHEGVGVARGKFSHVNVVGRPRIEIEGIIMDLIQ